MEHFILCSGSIVTEPTLIDAIQGHIKKKTVPGDELIKNA